MLHVIAALLPAKTSTNSTTTYLFDPSSAFEPVIQATLDGTHVIERVLYKVKLNGGQIGHWLDALEIFQPHG